MPQYIVKPERGRDFYVHWSTVTDSPWAWGTMLELQAEDDDGSMRSERFERADRTGTSSLDGFFGWDDDSFIVYNMGDEPFTVDRADLIAWLGSIVGDGGAGTTWEKSLTKVLILED